MEYTAFRNKVKSIVTNAEIVESIQYFDKTISVSADSRIFINNEEVKVKTLDEAKSYIDTTELKQDIQKEIYEEVLENDIIRIIKEEHKTNKVTENLLEAYIDFASSKIFTTDKTVHRIRELNKHDCVLEGKFDYLLEDGSVVFIEKTLQELLNNYLATDVSLIEYMRESKENFTAIVEKVLEE